MGVVRVVRGPHSTAVNVAGQRRRVVIAVVLAFFVDCRATSHGRTANCDVYYLVRNQFSWHGERIR